MENKKTRKEKIPKERGIDIPETRADLFKSKITSLLSAMYDQGIIQGYSFNHDTFDIGVNAPEKKEEPKTGVFLLGTISGILFMAAIIYFSN